MRELKPVIVAYLLGSACFLVSGGLSTWLEFTLTMIAFVCLIIGFFMLVRTKIFEIIFTIICLPIFLFIWFVDEYL